MAEENDLTLEEESSKGGNKMMIIIIAAVVIIVGAAAAFFLLSGDDADPEAAAEGTETTEEVVAETQPAEVGTAKYVTMPRPFTFNVPGTTRDRIVNINVQLMVRGEDNEELAQTNLTLIEATLLKAFSTATADELATPSGKDALKVKALKDVQTKANERIGSKIVEEILFTDFVMQ